MFKELIQANKNKEYVLKKNLEKLTGGVIKSHTFATWGKAGIETPQPVLIGACAAYRIKEIVEWLETHCEVINNVSTKR